jgi:hypothetical protein
VAYFIAAHWLKISHVPAVSQVVSNIPGERVRLLPSYERFLGSGFAVIAVDRMFGGVTDSVDNNTRPTILIYEDDRRLGPVHSNHADVGSVGRGTLFSLSKPEFDLLVFLERQYGPQNERSLILGN